MSVGEARRTEGLSEKDRDRGETFRFGDIVQYARRPRWGREVWGRNCWLKGIVVNVQWSRWSNGDICDRWDHWAILLRWKYSRWIAVHRMKNFQGHSWLAINRWCNVWCIFFAQFDGLSETWFCITSSTACKNLLFNKQINGSHLFCFSPLLPVIGVISADRFR